MSAYEARPLGIGPNIADWCVWELNGNAICTSDGDMDEDMAKYTAHALNCAPKLADALRDIVRYVSPGDDVPFAAMLDEARAALAEWDAQS